MTKRYIINWELSLTCNLDCSFCSQKERRQKNRKDLALTDIFSIIRHLPELSHISFLWGETLLFPDIMEVFRELETRGITYEITTNGILLDYYSEAMRALPHLTKITISIDGYWEEHDRSREKKGLFDTIVRTLPKITPHKNVAVSTVLTFQDATNIFKLHVLLDRLWIPEHKIIYCMQFNPWDVQCSLGKIPELQIDSPGDISISDEIYRKFFLQAMARLRKYHTKNTVLSMEPNGLFSDRKTYCKQIKDQYRINEHGKLSICEFISNSFGNIIENEFEESIGNGDYVATKKKISDRFPLDICKTCCKNCSCD